MKTTVSTNVLADKLRSMGITSGRKLAEHTDAEAVIYFLAKDEHGNNNPRAELHDLLDKAPVTVYWPDEDVRTLSAARQQTLKEAVADATRRWKLGDWRKTPFSNCWLPVEAINLMRVELGVDPLSVEPRP
jgi:hypothetical protein